MIPPKKDNEKSSLLERTREFFESERGLTSITALAGVLASLSALFELLGLGNSPDQSPEYVISLIGILVGLYLYYKGGKK
jgi:hypothetical protein